MNKEETIKEIRLYNPRFNPEDDLLAELLNCHEIINRQQDDNCISEMNLEEEIERLKDEIGQARKIISEAKDLAPPMTHGSFFIRAWLKRNE